MKVINYKNFLKIQNNISIDNITQRVYDYGEIKTTLSYTLLANIFNIEEFVCMAWKKEFYEDDKFDYAFQKRERGIIKKEDLPKDDDFLIDINCNLIKDILKLYLSNSDYEALGLNLKEIIDCCVLSKNKNINFDYKDISYEYSFIFKDKNKIYMIENCIDC